MSVKAIVFDFDGTLVDSNHIKKETYYKLFSDYGDVGASIVTRVLSDLDPSPRAVIIGEILDRLINKNRINADKAEKIKDYMINQYGQICRGEVAICQEIEGATNSLRKLSARYSLYINSLTPKADLEFLIRRRELSRYFTELYGSENSKTENLRTIMRNNNLAPEQIVVVGDGISDLKSAQDLNAYFIGIGAQITTYGVKSCLSNCLGLYESIEDVHSG